MLAITISIGASCQEPGGEGTPYFDALLGSAEDALLEAQNNGGDRVVLWRPGAEASEH